MDKAVAFEAKFAEIEAKRNALRKEESDLIEKALQFAADEWNKRFPEGSEERERRDGEPVRVHHLVMPMTWKCGEDDNDNYLTPAIEKSPVGFCIYDVSSEMGTDECIFCGSPEERQ